MQFDTLVYLLFFTLSFLTISLFGWKKPWVILILSLAFYAWQGSPVLMGVLITSIVGNYLIGIQIEIRNHRKLLLVSAWCWNLGFIAVFKYALANFQVEFGYIVPLGLSYFTLQSLSYCIDVYHGVSKSERSIVVFASFVSFFPQLVIGPIERSSQLIPQLKFWRSFDYEQTVTGARMILVGYFMKMVLANRLNLITEPVFENFGNYDPISCLTVPSIFAIQLYFDFGGYSLIAIGCAKMLGINLSDNFNKPFTSTSVSEFWRRWHMSISFWFRDYIFIPIFRLLKNGGIWANAKIRYFLGIWISFILLGMWHNVSWNFLIVGVIQAVFLSAEQFYKPRADNTFYRWLSRLYVFSVFSLAVLFFKTPDLNIISQFASNIFISKLGALSVYGAGNEYGIDYRVTFSLVFLFLGLETIQPNSKLSGTINSIPIVGRWLFYFLVFALVLTLGVFFDTSTFIYRQF